MSIRSISEEQCRRTLREMRMNKRKRRSQVDYSEQDLVHHQKQEPERKKPIIVVIYER